MTEDIAQFVGAFLIAKTLSDALMRVRGPIRLPALARFSMRIMEMTLLVFVTSAAPAAVLPLAIVFRIGYFVAGRLIMAINHSLLEFLMLLIIYRLWAKPAALVAVMQIGLVSVWIYSVFQKLYHAEFVNGLFFYTLMQRQPWFSRLVFLWRGAAKPAIQFGKYVTRIDPLSRHAVRRMAWVVVIMELVTPLFGLRFSGSVVAVVVMGGLAMMVGVATRELSFMMTNIIVAPLFLVPFDKDAFWSGAVDPLVCVILVWMFTWPLLHAVLARSLRFSSWRLFGWGMYATQIPSILTINGRGEILDAEDSIADVQRELAATLVKGFGACRIRCIRGFAWKAFFRIAGRESLKGAILCWYRLEGDWLISHCAAFRRGASEFTLFEIRDEKSEQEFKRFVRTSIVQMESDQCELQSQT